MILLRANLAQADIALVVADESAADPDAHNVLKVLTIEKFCTELENSGLRDTKRENIYTIAEISRPEYEGIARDADVDEIISFGEIQSKIFANSALNRGVNDFVNEILTFNNRNDIYTIPISRNSKLNGLTFDEILPLLRQYKILLLSICISPHKYPVQASEFDKENASSSRFSSKGYCDTRTIPEGYDDDSSR